MSIFGPNKAVRRHARLSSRNIDDTIEFFIKNNADLCYARPQKTIFSISKLTKDNRRAYMCPDPPWIP